MRHSDRSRPRALVVALLLVSALVPWGPAHAESDPQFVGWSEALPPVAVPHVPSASDDCVAGRPTCVSKIIREMEQQFAPLAASCHHRAVFALAYLRTTQNYLRSSGTPGFYQDPAYVNHEAVTFAEIYFEAVEDWDAGRRSEVPPAWAVALQAAQEGSVTGSGDLLLGMNAHINRDLPFTLARIGIAAREGPAGSRTTTRSTSC